MITNHLLQLVKFTERYFLHLFQLKYFYANQKLKMFKNYFS